LNSQLEPQLEPLHVESFNRIVIKIGSALLVDQHTGLRRSWLASLVEDISQLKSAGKQIIVVSSGAIALGRRELGQDANSRSLKLEESQAAAAVGQIVLSRAYSESLSQHQVTAGQILLTLGDTETRRRYLNARATIDTLLSWGAVPIINENDSVATNEIRYGDNDRLAARVASMTGADLLILLSDIDGLYTASPADNPQAELIPWVTAITPEIEAMAGDAVSATSRGGMKTKIEAAKIATASGTTMVIASGKIEHPLSALKRGARSTWFAPSPNPINKRKKWIAAGLAVTGTINIDQGAIKAIKAGKSLLPAGVTQVTGEFSRGDTIEICDQQGTAIGRGLSQYDFIDALKSIGLRRSEIEALFGPNIRSTMIHRDDLVLK
jgi:glutamate 5-kinase